MLKIALEQKIKGVYGPLIDLFDCDERVRKCVEVTASNRFFLLLFFFVRTFPPFLIPCAC